MKRPGNRFPDRPCPHRSGEAGSAAPLRCFWPNLVPAPAEAAEEAEAVAVADMRPSPGSPIRPGTSASPVEAAEAEAAEAVAAGAAARRNYT